MTFAYPIYTDRTNKENVRFYYCSDKKSGSHQTNHSSGTVLDKNLNVLFSPSITQVKELDNYKKLAMLDGTVVHLYNFDGSWYMGTKNSWNISTIYDISPTNYGEYFTEAITKYQFSYDMLDENIMYTVIFTNPKCHLLAQELGVYVYNDEDPLAKVFDILPETTDEHNYIGLSGNQIVVQQSELRKLALNLLYKDRKRCHSSTYELAFAKLYITALCNCKPIHADYIKLYLMDNSNELGKRILADVFDVANNFEEANNVIDEFLGKSIPIDLLNQSHDSTLFNPRHIGFFISIYREHIANIKW